MKKQHERKIKSASSCKNTVILYHDRCSDGFSAAWAVWKKFRNRAEYIGVLHQTSPPDGLSGKDIYMVDFSYESDVMKVIKKKANKLVVIDHHVSAIENIKHSDEYIFDNNKSGAVLSWGYFHKNKKLPKLLEYIQDRDLWRWELPNSKKLLVAIDMFKFDFNIWDKLAKDFESYSGRKKYIKIGEILLNYKDGLVEGASKNFERIVFEGKTSFVVNSGLFESEIGDYLVNSGAEIAIIWQKTKDGIRVSLRSPSYVDVSEIAKKYGGGGHKQASGFLIKDGRFPWKVVIDKSDMVDIATKGIDVKKYVKILEKRIKMLESKIFGLNKLVDSDFLTGLYNRSGFLKEVLKFLNDIVKEEALRKSGVKRKISINNLTFLFIDVVKFKKVNDLYGHRVGDIVLKKIANILLENVRDIDIVARWSGDEFVVVLIGDDLDDAQNSISRIKIAVEKAIKKEKRYKLPKINIGAASVYEKNRCPKLITNVEKLLDLADKRMYKDKKFEEK